MSFHGLIAHFFLEINSILLYGYATVGYRRSSFCVQVLAIMNKIVTNIHVQFWGRQRKKHFFTYLGKY